MYICISHNHHISIQHVFIYLHCIEDTGNNSMIYEFMRKLHLEHDIVLYKGNAH